MKQLVLLFSIFLISYNLKAQTQSNGVRKLSQNKHALDLLNNGFLKFSDSSKINFLVNEVKNSFNIYEEDNFKIAHIDAEELAEFSFGFFLPKLNEILARRDVSLSVQELNHKDSSYEVIINGDTTQLYTQKELDDDTFWEIASRNFFKKVNEIIKVKSIDEQFYLLYGGNDLHTMLLTDKQFEIISDYYKNEPKEMPYKPLKHYQQ